MRVRVRKHVHVGHGAERKLRGRVGLEMTWEVRTCGTPTACAMDVLPLGYLDWWVSVRLADR